MFQILRDYKMLNLKKSTYISYPFHPRLWDNDGKEGETIIRVIGVLLQENYVSLHSYSKVAT